MDLPAAGTPATILQSPAQVSKSYSDGVLPCPMSIEENRPFRARSMSTTGAVQNAEAYWPLGKPATRLHHALRGRLLD